MIKFIRLIQVDLTGAWITALLSCTWSALFRSRGWFDLVAAVLVLAAASLALLLPLWGLQRWAHYLLGTKSPL